ncbi:hypothetical protein [Arthrobacter sp. NicSoilB8]|uniref:hypothetical protein n=1 Tax=Arthrobacter sp. NicSoilB8 TaxID=2830998 RepID=UPI001CC4AE1A|nr:hypothetical protein [Arthrobacter sp. NicSoilB8]BCW69039.1 hypothetical protein NicSoilB8_00830 [Arthrobacter sp. NicSoilB8]
MTLTPEAPSQTRGLQVRTDAAGKPLAIRHDGQIWLVDPGTDPQHWFGRNPWPDTRPAAAADGGDLGNVEHWQVRVLGSNSALRTFTLLRDPHSTQWLLEDNRDGD